MKTLPPFHSELVRGLVSTPTPASISEGDNASLTIASWFVVATCHVITSFGQILVEISTLLPVLPLPSCLRTAYYESRDLSTRLGNALLILINLWKEHCLLVAASFDVADGADTTETLLATPLHALYCGNWSIALMIYFRSD